MSTHLEVSMQRDLDRIRAYVTEMGALAEQALQDAIKALVNGDRQLAYTVILRDLFVDEKEKEIDRLCLEFLVRQQPVAGTLRFVYSAIRINLELERVGDYAESIARQVAKLIQQPVEIPKDGLLEIARYSMTMLRDAVAAFVGQNPELARKVIEVEEKVDVLKSQLIRDLVNAYREQKIPFESLDPLTTIVRRLERVADQSRDICMETIYACTGEYSRHPGSEVFRVLFVDNDGAGLAIMAEAIALAMNQPKFVFGSAGLKPQLVSPGLAAFLQEKGHDTGHLVPRSLDQVPNLEHYHLVIALSPAVNRALPPHPRKGISIEWQLPDPAVVTGTPAEVQTANEATYQTLCTSINDLVQALLRS